MPQTPRHHQSSDDPQQAVTVGLARLHARAWGIAVGLLLGFVLAAATLLLVAKGGTQVGQHLALLGVFLPGYSVSVRGALVGFVYLFVIGYALGRFMGTLYNAFARDS